MKVKIVSMDDVPDPGCGSRRGKYADLYDQIAALKVGQAVEVAFDSDKQANYCRTQLRIMAKRNKQFLSSSKSNGDKTRYFWLEKAI